jgi:hypothetical protein
MANYDFEPSVYEANGDGSFTYRWDIKEVQKEAAEEGRAEPVIQWVCKEVVVWATVTKEKLTAAVLSALWDSDYEAKLQNDYNAAKMGQAEASYVKKYEDFIRERKRIKKQVNKDFREINGIARTLQDAIDEKISDVEDFDTSSEVNSFLVNGQPCWIDKEMRAVYGNSVSSAKMLGEERIDIDLAGMVITLPIANAELMLASIQRYADKAAIVTAKHKREIASLSFVDEGDSYNFKTGYPDKITLEIPAS